MSDISDLEVSVSTGALSPNGPQKPTSTSLEDEDASMAPGNGASSSTDAVTKLAETVEEEATKEKKAVETAKKTIDEAKEEAVEVVKTLEKAGVDETTLKTVEDEKVEKVKAVIEEQKKIVNDVKKEGAKKVAEATETVKKIVKKETPVSINAIDASKKVQEVAKNATETVKKMVAMQTELAKAPPAVPAKKKSITFEPIIMTTKAVPACVGEFFKDSKKDDVVFGACAIKSDGTCPTTINKMCTTDRDQIKYLMEGAKVTMF